MQDPASVAACIKALSSTTFVAEVTAPALAVLAPLLIRALNDRSMDVQRRTVVVVDNLVKLVRDPVVAATYLNPLVEGVEKIAKGAAFPEVRAFAETALDTLHKAGASKDGPPPPQRDIATESASVYSTLLTLLPQDLVLLSASQPNGPHTPRHPLLASALQFSSALVADLVYKRRFSDVEAWKRCLGVYLSGWFPQGSDEGMTICDQIRKHFLAVDKVSIPCKLAHAEDRLKYRPRLSTRVPNPPPTGKRSSVILSSL